jgi:DNA-binding CsgD family transcriptional regulator
MSAEVATSPGSVEELSADSARELTDQIRTAVVRTIDVLGEVDDLIARAFEGRAWLALGHKSWEAYCAAEFGHARLWQSVAERQATTLRLREAGLSLRAAAAVLGVSGETVRRDEREAQEPAPVSTVSDEAVDTSTGLDGRRRPAHRQDSEQVRRRTAQVVALRSQGSTQVEIASELGVAQSTVSAYLSAAAARGALDPSSLLGIPEPDEAPVEEVAPGPGAVPSRGQALLAEARTRASALVTHAAALRDSVVDVDEWTTDPLLAADVADAVAQPLLEAAGALAYVLAHLDVGAVASTAPASAHVHVARARRVRQIAGAVAAGHSPTDVAEEFGIAVETVAGVLREVAGLPPDRRGPFEGGTAAS